MNNNKQANPIVVVLMVVAIVGFLGFAVKQAMVPDKLPPKPDQVQAGPADLAPAPQAVPEQRPKPAISVEAAPGVNPFKPLPFKREKGSQQASITRQPVLPPSPAPSAGPVPAPVLIARDRERRSAALASSTREGTLPATPGGQLQPATVTVEPVLMGTMLGSRPVAVFKADKDTVMVPEGGAYLGWRVVRVGHGEATVWNGNVSVRLKVGGPSQMTVRSAMAPPAPANPYASANCITLHFTGKPAPTRRELVLGRMEEDVLEPIGEPGSSGLPASQAERESDPADVPSKGSEIDEGGVGS